MVGNYPRTCALLLCSHPIRPGVPGKTIGFMALLAVQKKGEMASWLHGDGYRCKFPKIINSRRWLHGERGKKGETRSLPEGSSAGEGELPSQMSEANMASKFRILRCLDRI